ncbi:methyltransferase domain-containing protein [Aestuariibacter halophilus]|uniref:tRNA 5-carboxymethoxyuridine methyltransferase n=1 Tax=Fluctibacter halophilus TaxID=226011 RepID=A0ABS8G4K4_9ALTE|nr:methyltransferase domain-containing protein [Aestuariibacter halophilus]MCC2615517.1 methyltransferase domain-containing protein [Aestuariibacter halophilus]
MTTGKRPTPQDHSFDALAQKFETNIYGTSKGQLRHQLLLSYLDEHCDIRHHPRTALDIGGGTGVMTADLARFGHTVTLNDVSADVLALARDKLTGVDNVAFHHGPWQHYSPPEPVDLILSHAVMEWLAEPLEAIGQWVDWLAVDGYLSLSFFNLTAKRYANLLYGNFDYVEAGMPTKNTVRMNPTNAVDPLAVIDYLGSQPVTIVHQAGIRCIHDYMSVKDRQECDFDKLVTMERKYGRQEPYQWLGKYYHIIVQRRD